MNFQRIVLYLSIISLLLTLTFMGYLLYRAKSSTAFPPEIAECPDYWKVTGPMKCQNVQNLGSETCEKNKDFSTVEWQGPSGLRKKKEWAKGCGLVWDGITNNKDL